MDHKTCHIVGTWPRIQGVGLAFKFPRSQSHWAAITNLIHHDLALQLLMDKHLQRSCAVHLSIGRWLFTEYTHKTKKEKKLNEWLQKCTEWGSLIQRGVTGECGKTLKDYSSPARTKYFQILVESNDDPPTYKMSIHVPQCSCWERRGLGRANHFERKDFPIGSTSTLCCWHTYTVVCLAALPETGAHNGAISHTSGDEHLAVCRKSHTPGSPKMVGMTLFRFHFFLKDQYHDWCSSQPPKKMWILQFLMT